MSETVSAARVLGFEKAAGFVNAILRRFQREQADILHAVDRDLALRTAHPRWIVEALRKERGGNAPYEVLEANNAHPPLWLRANRMRTDVAGQHRCARGGGFQGRARIRGRRTRSWSRRPPTSATLPGFLDGSLSVQDAAAQLAVELLDPQPGERILDACAAPGGKTCHVLERTGGNVELHGARHVGRAAWPVSRKTSTGSDCRPG